MSTGIDEFPCENGLDSDCENPLHVCYTDGFCNCEFYHGWTGDDCKDFGPGVKFLIVMATFQIIGVCILLYKTYRLSKYLALEHSYMSYTCRVYYLLLAGFVGFFFWKGVTLRLVTTPEKLNKVDIGPNGEDERYHDLQAVENASIGLLMTIITFTISSVGSLWLDTATRIKTHIVEYERKRSAFIWLDRIFIGIQLIWVAVYIVLLAINVRLATLVASFLVAFQGLLLAFSYMRIKGLLLKSINQSAARKTARGFMDGNKIVSESEKLRRSATVIQWTAYGLLGSYISFMIGISLFMYFTFGKEGWKSFAAEDKVSPNIISLEVVSISTIVFLLTCYYFIKSSFKQYDNVRVRAKSEENFQDVFTDKEVTEQEQEAREVQRAQGKQASTDVRAEVDTAKFTSNEADEKDEPNI